MGTDIHSTQDWISEQVRAGRGLLVLPRTSIASWWPHRASGTTQMTSFASHGTWDRYSITPCPTASASAAPSGLCLSNPARQHPPPSQHPVLPSEVLLSSAQRIALDTVGGGSSRCKKNRSLFRTVLPRVFRLNPSLSWYGHRPASVGHWNPRVFSRNLA